MFSDFVWFRLFIFLPNYMIVAFICGEQEMFFHDLLLFFLLQETKRETLAWGKEFCLACHSVATLKTVMNNKEAP